VGFDYFDEKGDVVAFVKTNRLTTSRPEMGTVHRLELSWSSVQIGGPVSPSAMGSTATVFKGNISNVFGSGEHITPQPTLGTQTIAKWRSSSSFVRTGGQRQPISEGVATLPCAIKKFGEGGVVKLNLKELRRIEKELKLNFRCDHLNVAPLIGMIRTEGALCAVMPLASHNLDEHFDRENDWSAKFRLAMDVCNGVHYLHINAAIVHNDIKPDNVLIFLEREVYVAKVSDLGSGFSAASATQASDGRRAAALGSVGYSAPEVGKSSANLEQSPTIS
jgi:serine/threonine protein kinase